MMRWFRAQQLATLEPIDAHTHIFHASPSFHAALERVHIRALNILYVDDTNPYLRDMNLRRKDVLDVVGSSGGRVRFCATFDPFGIANPDFERNTIHDIDQDFARGAVAVKVWKNLGMELRDGAGQYILPDDPRLQPIYEEIAARNKTLIVHSADPDVAWGLEGPGRRYYASNPQWDMSKQTHSPLKRAILDSRDHLVAMNPSLRVIGAHLGSMELQLDDLARCLDKYPNFAVDTAARVPQLATQSREMVREFILRYQDRILYGTDLNVFPQRSDEAAAAAWEGRYEREYRYFATADTVEYDGVKSTGLDLPRSVLKKIYHDNAVHWIPGIDAK
jgi:hypothetical protein